MINIKRIRIKNYRTIASEQSLDLSQGLVLVGPNNSGKTNTLRAIRMLFTGYDNCYNYKVNSDLTYGVSRAKTSIVATFEGNREEDKEIYNNFDMLSSLLELDNSSKTEIPLSVYFTESNNPVYRIFANAKRPKGSNGAKCSKLEKAIVEGIINSFSVYYVSSSNGFESIYDELLMPFLRKIAAKNVEKHVKEILNETDNVSSFINNKLQSVGLSGYKSSFSLPNGSVESLLHGFDLRINDFSETSVFEKGMGIQSVVMLASFLWITEQEKKNKKTALWLMEEPESYLHPELLSKCKTMLEGLGSMTTVCITTHSLGFMPKTINKISGCQLNKKETRYTSYKSFQEATSELRSSLGILFSDYYSLEEYNVFCEGPTDVSYITFVISIINNSTESEKHSFPNLSRARITDFGGVAHIAGFLRATHHLISKERACVSIFDADDQGHKERRNLQRFFGNKKIPFESNIHFVSIRNGFSIEGMFPDEWIIDMHSEHKGWFEHFSVDFLNTVEPFSIKDRNKQNAFQFFKDKVLQQDDLWWATLWIKLLDTIDSALAKQAISLAI